MNRFAFARAQDAQSAIAALAGDPHAAFIAGGTNVVDLMKDDAVAPTLLVDINALPFSGIDRTLMGIRVGALAKMSDVADHPAVQSAFPVVAEALLQSASPQLRNMATIGGNIMQRTRCAYFRDVAVACNKRSPGTGCSALAGVNRMHAVLGGSGNCICVHASDLAVALLSVDARVHVTGPTGSRTIPFGDFYLLPGSTPQIETRLKHGDLITAVELTTSPHAQHSTYLKIRDRASYEFALVSVAVGLGIENATIRTARIVLGGVAPVPWRSQAAEQALVGKPPSIQAFRGAAQLALQGARGYGGNDFKVELARRAVVRALRTTAGVA